MEILFITLRIRIYRAIVAPDHGKDFVDSLNLFDKEAWGKKLQVVKYLTTTCEILGMLYSASSMPYVSFEEQC